MSPNPSYSGISPIGWKTPRRVTDDNQTFIFFQFLFQGCKKLKVISKYACLVQSAQAFNLAREVKTSL